ncbi:alpha/beta hydrolase [Lysinibacillus agricola]|uniref:Alpha/beta hydrolase n=1 Tax=Lysinibacillus agricola TaxID=2590012 RepID=A0ABX7AYV3_9BACI|nr:MULTISPECIES: alpha/beta hydrolase [Lysinibacillus]KOS60392.1 alpha/beta hydrolase [Lysinibacillus sp. FJAT-14222]QQP15056.1 alpha/beta hydrolase [Lysinibacillus agricola]
MPTCTINNVDLYYEIKGKGEPIIFTHGASWDKNQWDKQVDYFSQYYQTITWDVRGHGASSLPKGMVDAVDFRKDLIGLMNHLQIKNAHLCGLSMGGHISLQTAIHNPEYVKSLILIGTPFTNKFNWYEKLLVPLNRFSNLFIPMSVSAKIQAYTLSKFNKENKHYINSTVASMSYKNWVRIWNAVSRMESRNDLDKVNCSTLILYGEKDTMIKRQQEYLHNNIKQSQLIIIDNAHHATNLDNPNQVNENIHQHLINSSDIY